MNDKFFKIFFIIVLILAIIGGIIGTIYMIRAITDPNIPAWIKYFILTR